MVSLLGACLNGVWYANILLLLKDLPELFKYILSADLVMWPFCFYVQASDQTFDVFSGYLLRYSDLTALYILLSVARIVPALSLRWT